MSASKLALACTIGAAVATSSPKAHELTAEYSFAQYQKHFGKVYKDAAEHAARQAIFEANLKKILTHNNPATGSSWKMGVNHFTDKEPHEVPRGYLSTQKRQAVEGLKRQPHVGTHKPSNKTLPKHVDWRTKGVVTPVKDQGQCGDCWAFSTVEAVESQWAIKHPGELWTLSVQQVSDCTYARSGCQGGLMWDGWNQMISATKRDGSVSSEWRYPFTSHEGVGSTCKKGVKGSNVKVTGYNLVSGNGTEPELATADQVMDAVANAGPLSIAVDASTWSQYDSGIFDGCKKTSEAQLDHAVILVGYGTDEASGKDYWLVRNSWAVNWGEDGYIRLLREKRGSGTGECGLLLDTCYPVVA